MIAKKKSFKVICPLLLLLGGAVVVQENITPTVTIESIESKTEQGHPIYNKIKLYASSKKDVWVMNQSHFGFKAPLDQWDEIKIVVDKKVKPYQVSYHQMKDGTEIEFMATCYTCHSNGPRIIRPNYASKEVSYSLQDKLAIGVMNLKMKMYGKVVIKESNFKLNGEHRKIPLKFFGKNDTETVKVKTCTYCHKADGFLARGELQRQHMMTASHLTQTHQMPPWPFKLDKAEKKELKKFLKGF
jgi:hypothetical protein